MICSILASTNLGGIGNRGTLPWPKHPQDMIWFKEHTENQIVVMGRNTWDDPKMPNHYLIALIMLSAVVT